MSWLSSQRDDYVGIYLESLWILKYRSSVVVPHPRLDDAVHQYLFIYSLPKGVGRVMYNNRQQTS